MQCPLCHNDVNKFHEKSHLVPEWMYTDCYNDNHKIIEINTLKSRKGKAQKGVYASITCEDCEDISQRYDHYASLILTNRSPYSPEYLSIQRSTTRRTFDKRDISYSEWSGISFTKFQKFVFGVMLRTHLYNKQNGNYLLIDRHYNKILDLYNSSQKLDDYSYPIVLTKLEGQEELNRHVILPCRRKHKGHWFIEFSGCGYIFNVYVSNHRKPEHVMNMRLAQEGKATLPHMYIQETGFWWKLKSHVDNISQ